MWRVTGMAFGPRRTHNPIPPYPQTHIPPRGMHVVVVGRAQPPPWKPPAPSPTANTPPHHTQVLTDSWGVGCIRTSCSRRPVLRADPLMQQVVPAAVAEPPPPGQVQCLTPKSGSLSFSFRPPPPPAAAAPACRRRRGRDARGQKQHLVGTGTTVLPSPTRNTFPRWLVDKPRGQCPPNNSNRCVHPEVPSVILAFMAPPRQYHGALCLHTVPAASPVKQAVP